SNGGGSTSETEPLTGRTVPSAGPFTLADHWIWLVAGTSMTLPGSADDESTVTPLLPHVDVTTQAPGGLERSAAAGVGDAASSAITIAGSVPLPRMRRGRATAASLSRGLCEAEHRPTCMGSPSASPIAVNAVPLVQFVWTDLPQVTALATVPESGVP